MIEKDFVLAEEAKIYISIYPLKYVESVEVIHRSMDSSYIFGHKMEGCNIPFSSSNEKSLHLCY